MRRTIEHKAKEAKLKVGGKLQQRKSKVQARSVAVTSMIMPRVAIR